MLPDPEVQPTLTVADAAQALGIGRNAAYEAVQRGELPSLRLGRRVLVPTAQLRRMLGLDLEREDAAGSDTGDASSTSPTTTPGDEPDGIPQPRR